MQKGSKMVDPVTIWPNRPVSRSVKDGGTHATRSATTAAREIVTGASLPKLVNLATELSKAGPPVDFAKIALVRQAIAQGEYSIDVDRIAHAMVGFFRTTD